jgi:hypothetical protein
MHQLLGLRVTVEGSTAKIDIKRRQLPNLLLSNIRSPRFKVDERAAFMEINDTSIACNTEKWLDANIETGAVDIENHISVIDGTDPMATEQGELPRQVSHIVVAVIYHPLDAASWPMCNY